MSRGECFEVAGEGVSVAGRVAEWQAGPCGALGKSGSEGSVVP